MTTLNEYGIIKLTCIGYHETNRQQAVKCHPYKSA